MPEQNCLKNNLYRRAIGEPFDRLPPALRRFHDANGTVTANGSFRITRGQGWFRNAAATLMKLPKAGDTVRVNLKVIQEGSAEIWARTFGSVRLVTNQWMCGAHLVEAAGPLRFGFRLSADDHSIQFDMERCWFLCVPIPMWIAPRVDALVTGQELIWHTRVEVRAPLLGMLVCYEGDMAPEC